jgi:hypothetical protein
MGADLNPSQDFPDTRRQFFGFPCYSARLAML